MNARGGDRHRDELLVPAHGRVIEVGAGAGATFAHYPRLVDSVLAVEPSDELRELALAEAERAPVSVTVVAGRAEAIPAPDGSADTVVTSLSLCSVEDLDAAVAEFCRVLTPGGQVLFYEHVGSSRTGRCRLERAATPLWSRIAGGCHLDRDPAAALRAGGFSPVTVKAFRFAPIPGLPRVTHVIGRAVRP